MNKKAKIIVGMSGGVDSSVAALLLHEQGYQVEGLFMKNWEEDDTDDFCPAAEDAADAEAVCRKIGIPLHTVNFAKDYWDNVFEYFLAEYKAGRTPNPDVMCNKEIKFKAFLDYARMELGADKIATGHYVRSREVDDKVELLRGIDNNKDQSYFLYQLGQAQLAPALFPIGDLEKPRVREMALEHGFITHDKKDSTGICFIGERKFKTFLQEYLPAQPGNIESVDGDVIGLHDGLMYYTNGQRQGLNIGGMKAGSGEAWYVVDKDLNRNVLLVTQGKNDPRLFKQTLVCEQAHWISDISPQLPFSCTAKIRYRQTDESCTIEQLNDKQLTVTFEKPQRAVTPGQSIVFYHNEVCLGGGIIAS
tara:strand:+ start:246605 stop:247690 length:1086 start_codon:yes stop_codon:yes gene_type:complete